MCPGSVRRFAARAPSVRPRSGACALALAIALTACVSEPSPQPPPPAVSTQTFDPEGRPTDGRGLAMRVWGPGEVKPAAPVAAEVPAAATTAEAKEALPQQPSESPPAIQDTAQRQERDAALRNQFGSAVVIAPDGTVTKQYFLSGETATVFESLLREPGVAAPPETVSTGLDLDNKSQCVLARMIGEHRVRLTLFKDFEKIVAGDIKAVVTGANPPTATSVSNSLLLVTAQPQALAAFEAALNLFFSSVPQIELEVKVVEFQATDAVAFGTRPLDNDTPTFTDLQPARFVKDFTSLFPLAPPTVGTGQGAERGVLTLGGVHDGWELNARLEALELSQLADILSQPRLTVRNGGTASVSTLTQVPFTKAKFTSSGSNTVADIAFQPVGIQVNIRPVIAGTDTVILQIYAKVSAVTGFTPTEPVPTPTISEREVVTQVHVRHDQATTISGLLSKSTFDNVSKVPLLGDIPILGFLFRSTTKQETTQNVEFIIIPRIKYGLDRTEDVDFLNPLGG
ncbi:MAG: type II and III secretion system protein [Planctomycetota bacterium]